MARTRAVSPGRLDRLAETKCRPTPRIRRQIRPSARVWPKTDDRINPRARRKQPCDRPFERIAFKFVGPVVQRHIHETVLIEILERVAHMALERTVRANFEENPLAHRDSVLDSFVEEHFFANISPPIDGVRRLPG